MTVASVIHDSRKQRIKSRRRARSKAVWLWYSGAITGKERRRLLSEIEKRYQAQDDAFLDAPAQDDCQRAA